MAATTSKEIPASGDISVDDCRTAREMLDDWGLVPSIKPEFNVKGAYSKVVGGVLKLISAQKAKISCILYAKPPVLNGLGRLHGLAVASVSERVAIACAKTVVGNDKDIFLGDLSISYLSSAPRDAEVFVDASVVESGKNSTRRQQLSSVSDMRNQGDCSLEPGCILPYDRFEFLNRCI